MPNLRVTPTLRQAVRLRANGCCEYCHSQARFATEPFAVEHISPRSAGGTTDLTNLAFSCFGCNSNKFTKTHAIDPQTQELTALFHPRRQKWTSHFAWSDDFTLIFGLTATGRATINALQMNRVELVNLRGVLYAANEHPPQMD